MIFSDADDERRGQRRRKDAGLSATKATERHTFAVLVDNEAGVLARVVGLFSGRGYNIESLTVAEVDRCRAPRASPSSPPARRR